MDGWMDLFEEKRKGEEDLLLNKESIF